LVDTAGMSKKKSGSRSMARTTSIRRARAAMGYEKWIFFCVIWQRIFFKFQDNRRTEEKI